MKSCRSVLPSRLQDECPHAKSPGGRPGGVASASRGQATRKKGRAASRRTTGRGSVRRRTWVRLGRIVRGTVRARLPAPAAGRRAGPHSPPSGSVAREGHPRPGHYGTIAARSRPVQGRARVGTVCSRGGRGVGGLPHGSRLHGGCTPQQEKAQGPRHATSSGHSRLQASPTRASARRSCRRVSMSSEPVPHASCAAWRLTARPTRPLSLATAVLTGP